MAKVTLTNALRSEYTNLLDTCEIARGRLAAVDKQVGRIEANQERYKAVGGPLSIPWFFIGAIHNMESALNFAAHLHNGDPLTARTVQVPAGRPKAGSPPFSWEESAADALKLRGLERVSDWSVPGLLYQLEGYNGWGYRLSHPEVLTPYLWSGSNHYTSGKYVVDGKFDPAAVSAQLGTAVLLRRMAERQIIKFSQQGMPLVADDPGAAVAVAEPIVTYSETVVSAGAKTLQAALNRFPGVFLRVDGVPGAKTSDALKKVTGHFLSGDPRIVAAGGPRVLRVSAER